MFIVNVVQPDRLQAGLLAEPPSSWLNVCGDVRAVLFATARPRLVRTPAWPDVPRAGSTVRRRPHDARAVAHRCRERTSQPTVRSVCPGRELSRLLHRRPRASPSTHPGHCEEPRDCFEPSPPRVSEQAPRSCGSDALILPRARRGRRGGSTRRDVLAEQAGVDGVGEHLMHRGVDVADVLALNDFGASEPAARFA